MRRNNNRISNRLHFVCPVMLILIGMLRLFITSSGPAKRPVEGLIVRRLDEQLMEGLGHGPADSTVRKRVLLKPGEVPHLVGLSQAVLPPQGEVEWHVHETKYEVFLCESGVGIFSVAESSDTGPSSKDGFVSHDTVLGEGVTIAVKPRFFHSIRNTGKQDLVLTYFGIAED